MDLFGASGIDLPRSGATRRPVPRSLRVPLFAHKVIEEARGKIVFSPSDAQRDAAREYARKAKRRFGKLKETAVRPVLFAEVLVTILGYRTADPDAPFTLAFEEQLAAGSVDVALGRFSSSENLKEIVAPFELKGPTTIDLDAVSPGRKRSPVQQAWDYANDAPGARWVLVSNCVELRLYGYGRGREAYEMFDLARLDEEEEHARLWMLLSAERFLTGQTDALLRQTDEAYKDVTDKLYADYKALRDKLLAFLTSSADGPKLPQGAAIEPTQKILDRILFIAFAQRTDLLPARLLEDAAKERNKFDPQRREHQALAGGERRLVPHQHAEGEGRHRGISGYPRVAAAVQAGVGETGDEARMVGTATGAVGLPRCLIERKNCVPDISQGPKFCLDSSESFCANTIYFG